MSTSTILLDGDNMIRWWGKRREGNMKYKGPGSTSNSTNNEVGQENEKSLKNIHFLFQQLTQRAQYSE